MAVAYFHVNHNLHGQQNRVRLVAEKDVDALYEGISREGTIGALVKVDSLGAWTIAVNCGHVHGPEDEISHDECEMSISADAEDACSF